MELKIGEGSCEGKLPWGYLDDKGVVHNDIIVREMTGNEEEIFFSDSLEVKTRLAKIVSACTEKLGAVPKDKIADALTKITPADFMYILLLLRIASLGSKYSFKVTCEKCNKEFVASIDLKDIGVFDASRVGERNIREYSVPIAGGKKTVKIKVPNIGDIAKEEKTKKPKSDKMTDMLLQRVIEVDGKPVTREALLGLGMKDRHALRLWIRKAEVGIDDSIEASCSNPDCKFEFKTVLDIGQASFFFPEGDGS